MKAVLTYNLKPTNSTKKVNLPYCEYHEADGHLVNDTDITAPSVTFKFATVSPTTWNYMHIPSFGRYYFINDWTVSGDLWTAHCTVDVLASFKETIGASEQYVLRSSAESNPNLLDTMYPLQSSVEVENGDVVFVDSASIWKKNNYGQIHHGCFLLSVISNGSYDMCGITHYVLNFDQMASLMNYLMNDISWAGVEELSMGLSKVLFNPMQYLVSCTWLPKEPADAITVPSNTLYYGWWSFTINTGQLKVVMPGVESNIYLGMLNIAKHPDASGYNSYLNKSPFTTAALHIQPFGIVDIPLSMCESGVCYVFMDLDPVGGAAVLRLTSDRDGKKVISYKSAEYGVPVRFSQLTTDMKGFGLSLGADIMSSVLGDFADKVFGGSISNHLSGVASAIEGGFTKAETKGNGGAFLSYLVYPYLVVSYTKQADRDVEKHGLPLCKKKRLDTIPGFIMCEGARFSGSPKTLLNEKNMIENYLNTGFYYE